MNFFTPDLYLRFNSPDDEEADRADEEWESALREYRGHLDRLRGRMPAQVEKLAGLDLHDAEILAIDQPIEPFFRGPFEFPLPYWSAFAILSVKKGGEVVSLIYSLLDRVRVHPPEGPWPFSDRRRHWLYDEIDLAPDRPHTFLHRVLLSDGTVIEIPFLSVVVHVIPLLEGSPGEVLGRIA